MIYYDKAFTYLPSIYYEYKNGMPDGLDFIKLFVSTKRNVSSHNVEKFYITIFICVFGLCFITMRTQKVSNGFWQHNFNVLN